MLDGNLVIMIQALSSWAMVGIIWFVQVVHYPLMNQVGLQTFKTFERSHMRLTAWVVAPLMIVEMGSNLLLFWFSNGLNPGHVAIGLGLLSVIWLSTFLLQVPLHNRLLEGFDSKVHRRLVFSNWIRTIAWTARGFWALWLLNLTMKMN